jgi:hypothetical protein
MDLAPIMNKSNQREMPPRRLPQDVDQDFGIYIGISTVHHLATTMKDLGGQEPIEPFYYHGIHILSPRAQITTL